MLKYWQRLGEFLDILNLRDCRALIETTNPNTTLRTVCTGFFCTQNPEMNFEHDKSKWEGIADPLKNTTAITILCTAYTGFFCTQNPEIKTKGLQIPDWDHDCNYNPVSCAHWLFLYPKLWNEFRVLGTKKSWWKKSSGLWVMWAIRDSNPWPPRCKRGALNQLS